MNNKKEFFPVITINNSKEKKEVEIDGVKQTVEVTARKGFNIMSRNSEGEYVREFFLEELEGVVLFDRYQIKSKFNAESKFASNEFEFSGDNNHVKVYGDGKIEYDGTYQGAKEHFSTGKENKFGGIETTFDTFSVIYICINDEVFRFKQKLNGNNKWFDYCNEVDKGNMTSIETKFIPEEREVAGNKFWACRIEKGKKVERQVFDAIKKTTLAKIAPGSGSTPVVEKQELEPQEEININEIPF